MAGLQLCHVLSMQVVDRLSGHLPVFILADDWETTAEEIDDRFIGDAEIWQALHHHLRHCIQSGDRGCKGNDVSFEDLA